MGLREKKVSWLWAPKAKCLFSSSGWEQAPSAQPIKEHLILAFFAGVLLTLLLVILTLLIKSCRKCNSSAQTRYPHSEPPTKLSSISKESLTYASMTFKSSEENSNDLTRNHSSGLDPTVYSQIKVTDP
uniref:Similar to human chromosome 1 open reading frame 162 n=1 Tax=Rattus norvegicus TaxID=10116 RepID=A0A8I5ZTX9_RAT|nr:transmembrane protein C1orf162 homolog isoform X1 [Rattus norvegicus]XP_038959747.1 transmembrane protein C1orf162 homolog isoform X1 [Rattus norvegicus]XP_038959748.1 transmembrane protein C1orf162 homolog isoform X1 [Rattus norvegicus]|eukprot:XP_017446816.1 PREDICTED: transmembrane protein C1orf162 homolog isoform X1 [Rattus norvegicus]